jgi:transcriptional regulator with XRE-family HTH domain
MASNISQNVRFLLWRKKLHPAQWSTWLSERTNLPVPVLSGLCRGDLDDAQASEQQLKVLGGVLECGEEELRYSNLPSERCNILQENLRYLFRSLQRGGKRSLANELKIDPTTISRWLNGSSPPQGPSLRNLVSYFGLPPETDLRDDTVFLSSEPVALLERRKLIRERLETLPAAEFRELYPALKRLLEER